MQSIRTARLRRRSTAAEISSFQDESFRANPRNTISGKDTGAVMARYGERREHCPVADFKFLIDVMQVDLMCRRNIEPAPIPCSTTLRTPAP